MSDLIALNPASLSLTLVALAVLPLAALGMTSFLKLSVVFAILRSALGAGQVPSAAITTLLAFALSIHIMAPVGEEAYRAASAYSNEQEQKPGQGSGKRPTLEVHLGLLSATGEPFREFLAKHANEQELTFFSELKKAQEQRLVAAVAPPLERPEELSFSVLIPAFVLSELREAFAIGFTIFLPFLVVDLVVSNILVGLGMMMVSPATIALPLKLLLFVTCDGWLLVTRSLIAGYL